MCRRDSVSTASFAQGTEYQYGTSSALVFGQLGKVTTVKDVSKHNDFGLGAGVGLGEVIMVNGHAYIAGPKGKGRELKSSDGLSYMTATEFKSGSLVQYEMSLNESLISNIK